MIDAHTAMKPTPGTLGERMMQVRAARGATRNHVCRRTGVCAQSLYTYERLGTIPDKLNAAKLAAWYGDWLLKDLPPRKRPKEVERRRNSQMIERLHRMLRRAVADLHPDRRGRPTWTREQVRELIDPMWKVVHNG